MKRPLHCHLRANLPFGELELDTTGLLEPLPAPASSLDRAAKRQRVEKIAEDYLRRGQPPVLLSTSLKRGPFNGRWTNPWKPRPIQEEEDLSMREIQETYESPIVIRAQCTAQRNTEDRRSRRIGVVKADEESDLRSIQSVKTPFSERGDFETQDFVREVELTSPFEHAREPDRRRTLKDATGTRWLKRRKQGIRVPGNVDSPFQDTPYRSPTGPRGDSQTRLTLPVVKQIRRSPAIYPKAPVLETQLQSSASATMDISSPFEPTYFIEQEAQGTMQAPGSIDTSTTQHSTVSPVPSQQSHTPPGRPPSPRVEVPRGSQRQIPSRGEIQRRAEICADLAKASSRKETKKRAPRASKATARPSFGPLAFDGSFVYRKVGRKTAKGGQSPAPQPINFDSSPAVQPPRPASAIEPTGNDDSEKTSNQEDAPMDQGTNKDDGLVTLSNSQRRPPRRDVYEFVGDEAELLEEQREGRRRESDSTRESLFSTQAAFMLAHLEFQEDTCPSDHPSPRTSQTPRPATQIQGDLVRDTPKTIAQQKAQAFTPFHAFSEKPNKPQPAAESPMVELSTQDLFAAASPFAVSTVKKTTSTVPFRGSSLKFAITSFGNTLNTGAGAGNNRSPTPQRERSPFKDLNSQRSFLDTTGKGTQKSFAWSQDTMLSPQFRQRDPTEAPQLSFPTPLDGNLDFADQFPWHDDSIMAPR